MIVRYACCQYNTEWGVTNIMSPATVLMAK